MFSKICFFVVTLFTLLVAATTTTITEHPPNPSPVNSGNCNSIGYNPVCCSLAVNETPAPASSITFDRLTVVISAGTQLYGINCLPIIGGICAGHVLCCEHNSFGTLLNVGCVNIII